MAGEIGRLAKRMEEAGRQVSALQERRRALWPDSLAIGTEGFGIRRSALKRISDDATDRVPGVTSMSP